MENNKKLNLQMDKIIEKEKINGCIPQKNFDLIFAG